MAMNSYQWDIVGHQKVIQHLQGSLDKGQLAQSYIFSGPAHLGKKLIVEKFVASILCHDDHPGSKEKIPCQKCLPCKQLEKNIHPDVYWVKREEDKKAIVIEQIRDLKSKLSLSSFLNSYKIAVIEEADRMNEEAQNALLKILEEPTKKTILILITSDYTLLLPTIISRCRLIKFRPVKTELVYNYLIGLGATRPQAINISHLAAGRQGLAIDYFQNQELLENYKKELEIFFDLFEGDLVDKFNLVDALIKENLEYAENAVLVKETLSQWQLILRDAINLKAGLNDLVMHGFFQNKLQKLIDHCALAKLVALIKNIDQVKRYVDRNVNLKLALENLVLTF